MKKASGWYDQRPTACCLSNTILYVKWQTRSLPFFLDKCGSFGTPVWKELALFARIIGYKEGFCRKSFIFIQKGGVLFVGPKADPFLSGS